MSAIPDFGSLDLGRPAAGAGRDDWAKAFEATEITYRYDGGLGKLTKVMGAADQRAGSTRSG